VVYTEIREHRHNLQWEVIPIMAKDTQLLRRDKEVSMRCRVMGEGAGRQEYKQLGFFEKS
jgi:hypothetical protein